MIRQRTVEEMQKQQAAEKARLQEQILAIMKDLAQTNSLGGGVGPAAASSSAAAAPSAAQISALLAAGAARKDSKDGKHSRSSSPARSQSRSSSPARSKPATKPSGNDALVSAHAAASARAADPPLAIAPRVGPGAAAAGAGAGAGFGSTSGDDDVLLESLSSMGFHQAMILECLSTRWLLRSCPLIVFPQMK